ncbi:hypothetical protein D3C78_1510770 [compost metagenome]
MPKKGTPNILSTSINIKRLLITRVCLTKKCTVRLTNLPRKLRVRRVSIITTISPLFITIMRILKIQLARAMRDGSKLRMKFGTLRIVFKHSMTIRKS